MKLRLVTGKIAPKSGMRTEHFYNGELKVYNDEVETDNPNWIKLLYERGYKPVEEMTLTERYLYPDLQNPDIQEDAQEEPVAEVYQEEPVEPQGTQVVNEENFEDFKEVEPKEEAVPQETTNQKFWDSLDEDAGPSDLERMMSEALGNKTSQKGEGDH